MPPTRYDFQFSTKCFNFHYFSLTVSFPLLENDLPGKVIDPREGEFPKQFPQENSLALWASEAENPLNLNAKSTSPSLSNRFFF